MKTKTKIRRIAATNRARKRGYHSLFSKRSCNVKIIKSPSTSAEKCGSNQNHSAIIDNFCSNHFDETTATETAIAQSQQWQEQPQPQPQPQQFLASNLITEDHAYRSEEEWNKQIETNQNIPHTPTLFESNEFHSIINERAQNEHHVELRSRRAAGYRVTQMAEQNGAHDYDNRNNDNDNDYLTYDTAPKVNRLLIILRYAAIWADQLPGGLERISCIMMAIFLFLAIFVVQIYVHFLATGQIAKVPFGGRFGCAQNDASSSSSRSAQAHHDQDDEDAAVSFECRVTIYVFAWIASIVVAWCVLAGHFLYWCYRRIGDDDDDDDDREKDRLLD